MRGKFFVFEGQDNVGKTTQIQNLYQYLLGKGYKVCITAEPFKGTPKALELYNQFFNPDIDHKSRVLLVSQMRKIHLTEFILPRLKQGYIVLCDRFLLSTFVYQGVSDELNQFICEQHKNLPQVSVDKQIILTSSPQRILERIQATDKEMNIFDDLTLENIEHKQREYYDGLKTLLIYYPEYQHATTTISTDAPKEQVLFSIVKALNV